MPAYQAVTLIFPIPASPASNVGVGVYNLYAIQELCHFVTKLPFGAQPHGGTVFNRQRLAV
jgi:hypothetical protein